MVWEGLERERWDAFGDEPEEEAAEQRSSAFRFDFSLLSKLKVSPHTHTLAFSLSSYSSGFEEGRDSSWVHFDFIQVSGVLISCTY